MDSSALGRWQGSRVEALASDVLLVTRLVFAL